MREMQRGQFQANKSSTFCEKLALCRGRRRICPRRTQHRIGSASHVCLGGLATTPHDAAKTVPLENFSGDQVEHSVKHGEGYVWMLRRPLAAMLGSL